MISGFLNVRKSSGVSSNAVLGVIKRFLRQKGYTEKIGHLGTLDPLASGVLPVAIGRATRLFDYLLDKEKIYRATFLLGASSPTLDTDGIVTMEDDFQMPDRSRISDALFSQIGEIEQIPPLYSAKSVQGARAYDLARKGIEFSLKPKKVIVHSIELVDCIDRHIVVTIRCGGGTYVRSIGRDVAEKLGTHAVMSGLVREQSGPFRIEDSVDPTLFRENTIDLMASLVPMESVMSSFPAIIITEEDMIRLKNGLKISYTDNTCTAAFRVLVSDRLVGMGERDEDGYLRIKTWLL